MNAAALACFRSMRAQSVLLFGLALLVRLALATFQHAWVHPDRAELEREAISFAHTGVLGNPYSVPTGPSAHVTPLYALTLGLIFHIFGTGAVGESVKIGLTCLIASIQYALFPTLGRVLRLPAPIAFGAGLFGVLIPLDPYIEISGDFENHITALLLLLLILWTARLLRKSWTWREAAAFGLFCGTSVLITSVLLPIDILAILCIAFFQRRTLHGSAALGVLSFLMIALCLLPWAIRNERELGAPIYTRSNFGLEFFLANNDRASPLMLNNGALFDCCHPLQNKDEARKVQQLGEVEYERRLRARAKAWTTTHPGRFAQLVLERFWYTWMPSVPGRLREAMFRVITLLGVAGIFVVARISLRSAILLFVPLLVYPLPLYLVQVHVRYRYPIQFILLLTASASMYGAISWARHNRVGFTAAS